LKLFEAMAIGVPVVTADVGDRREHLGGGQAGLIVRPGSSEALAEGLLTLLSDPGRRQAMGDRGRELAAHYYWDVQVCQFARVYEL
jgi:glycosyltransferase involved in cell wall biosynthesis